MVVFAYRVSSSPAATSTTTRLGLGLGLGLRLQLRIRSADSGSPQEKGNTNHDQKYMRKNRLAAPRDRRHTAAASTPLDVLNRCQDCINTCGKRQHTPAAPLLTLMERSPSIIPIVHLASTALYSAAVTLCLRGERKSGTLPEALSSSHARTGCNDCACRYPSPHHP